MRGLVLLVCKIGVLFSLIQLALLLINMATKHFKPKMLVKSNNSSDINLKKSSTNDATISVIDAEAEMKTLNRKKVPADDPGLVRLIREHFIVPPSDLPYNLANADKLDTSMGQAPFVDNIHGFKEGGFFVESGAHDGEHLPNTLFLERTRHWTGILIEPLPEVFKQLQNKHRKAYSLISCLSVHPYPSMEYMSNIPVLGGIMKTNNSRVETVRVQCFPLHSVLLALNRTNVDFLSLDVEGVEHQVLETIPWNKVNITMLAIEYDKWIGRETALCKYMKRKGYGCALNLWIHGAADSLFQK